MSVAGEILYILITASHSNGIMVWLWVLVFVLGLLIDVVHPKPVSAWYSVGALFALIAYAFGLSLLWQYMVFAVGSFFAIFLIATYINKKSFERIEMSNLPDYIKKKLKFGYLKGKEGVIIKSIEGENSEGLVKVMGIVFPAISSQKQRIPAGTEVIVRAIRKRELGGLLNFLGGTNAARYILIVFPVMNSLKSGGENIVSNN